MKKYIISILMISAALLCGCKDELQDTVYDEVFFSSYDGQDIKFMDFTFEPKDSEGYYGCSYKVMTYLPEWPSGYFEYRYSKDHIFEADSCFTYNNVLTGTLLHNSFRFRGGYFETGAPVYFRACYTTSSGVNYISDEIVFRAY